MSNKIRDEVYRRLVLAKVLHRAGEAACANRNDQMVFAKGILLLHDAVEAALGAVADHLHARLTGNKYLLDYYKLIEKTDTQKRIVPYRIQMRNLNTLRNDVKHQGILPDIKSNVHFPITVHSLITDICRTYLGLDFSSVSFKSLIRDKEIQNCINQAEERIQEGKIKEALILLAYAMYHICESSTISRLVGLLSAEREGTQLQFTKPYEINYQVELMQHGVDPYLYYRFKNLTPNIVRHTQTGELFHRWDKTYGHPKNWTARNADFCLNFCIETALKFQREADEGYTLINYMEVYEDVIEPIKEEAIIWNLSCHPPKYTLQKSPKRSPVLTLKKGQSIIGWASDRTDILDEWFIISKDIPSASDKFSGHGYVLKSDVKVTPRER